MEIYSLETDAWKRRDGHGDNNINRYELINKRSLLPCVKGNGHWIVRKTMKTQEKQLEEVIILVFDMLEEDFHEISLPTTKGLFFEVTDFQETVALLTERVHEAIWLMKDYGVASSWTMLYNLGYMNEVPINIINDGQVILYVHKGTLAIYDPISRNQKKFGQEDVICQLAICNETLALLDNEEKVI